MSIDYAYGLQIRVDNGCADKPHAPPSQVFRDAVRKGRSGAVALIDGLAVCKAPYISVKTPVFFLYFHEHPSVPDGGGNFQPVAYNALALPKQLHFCRIVLRHFRVVKPVKGLSKRLPFVKHALPRQSCLKALQHQQLKQPLFLMYCHAPFRVMVLHIPRITQVAPPAPCLIIMRRWRS